MKLNPVERLINHLDELEASIEFGIQFIVASILISLFISFILLPLLEIVLPDDNRSQIFILLALVLGGIVFFSLAPIAFLYMFLTAIGLIILKKIFLPHF